MIDIQTRLREFTRSTAVPYLQELPELKPHMKDLCVILVGSAATGLCGPNSDVDIALTCDQEVFDVISQGTSWHAGRPTEVRIDGTQLHYYAVPFEQLDERVAALDDAYLYLYTNIVILHDPNKRYAGWLDRVTSSLPELRRDRLEGKLDMLLRRARALESCIQSGDELVLAQVYLEIITRMIKVVALLDGIPFNPRKRLMGTALSGPLGQRIAPQIRNLFPCFAMLPEILPAEENVFASGLSDILNMLSVEATIQGFRVGLDRPDRRQINA